MKSIFTPYHGKQRTSKAERVGQRIICVFLALLAFVMIYPLWHVIMYSISDPIQAMEGGMFLLPKGFSIYSYKLVFRTSQIWVSIRVTVLKTLLGTALSVFLSLTTAYPLSLPRFRGRRFFQGLIFFTMLFGGGTIPTYLLVNNLGMIDTFWALIIPGCINAYNMFILRNALQAIPAELEESARMDGATPLRICFQIVAPIAAPTLAAISMFYGLANWNSYFDGLLYTNSSSLQLMQLYLRTILTQTSSVNSIMSAAGEKYTTSSEYLSQSSMQMTIVVITVLPILAVYPWLSRYYVTGLSVGAVKG